MKVRHMRTSKSGHGGGHFHYIDYIDSSGNGQTKMFISKRTKKRHLHKIRNFVVSIADGHTHMLKRKEDKGGGTLLDANPSMVERRRIQYKLPRGFIDRREQTSEVVTTMGDGVSRRSVKALTKASDLMAKRRGRVSNRDRTRGINSLNRPLPRENNRRDDDDSRY
tara:strand:- start:900 stop:1397 length:498 start_codon:yes stop_codon:yes gene_type:complete